MLKHDGETNFDIFMKLAVFLPFEYLRKILCVQMNDLSSNGHVMDLSTYHVDID